jgi:hypothetical protein
MEPPRGLKGRHLQLVVTDGCAGLHAALAIVYHAHLGSAAGRTNLGMSPLSCRAST